MKVVLRFIRFGWVAALGFYLLYTHTDLTTTFWVLGLYFLYLIVAFVLINIVPIHARYFGSYKMSVCIYASKIIAIGIWIFIFIRFGWVAALGFILFRFGIPPARIPKKEQQRPVSTVCQGLLEQYQASKKKEDLERVLECWRTEYCITRTDNAAGRSTVLFKMALALEDYYEHTQDLSDLDIAIEAYQQAAQEAPTNLPDLPLLLRKLCGALHKRFKRTEDRHDWEAYISTLEQAVQLLPPNDPIRLILMEERDTQLRWFSIHSKNTPDLDQP